MADTEGIDALRRKRGIAKGAVTRLQTQGDSLMTSVENLPQVKALAGEFDSAYQRFIQVHEEYHKLLTESSDIESSQSYIREAKFIFVQFRDTMEYWIADCHESQAEVETVVEHAPSEYDNAVGLEQTLPVNEDELNAVRAHEQQMLKEYEMKRQKMELEAKLERDRLALEIKLKREQRERQIELEQMRQELAQLEDTPRNPDGISMGGGLTHSTPVSAPRHPQGTQPVTNPDSHLRRSFEPSVAFDMQSILDVTQRQHQTLVESLQIPKTELSNFDGDPLHYWSFIRRFEYTMEKDTISDAAKLNALLHCCTGRARDLLRCCEVREPSEGYRLARKLLKERFGDENKISQAWIQKICNLPPLTGNAGLQDYADDLRCCKETLQAMGFLQEFETGQNLKTVLEKLPYRLRTRWLAKNQEIRRNRQPKFEDVVQFVELAASEVSDPVFGSLADSAPEKKSADKKKADSKKADSKKADSDSKQRTKGSFTTQASEPTPNATAASQGQGQGRTPRDPCWCCQGQHFIFQCPAFKAMKIKDRISLVRSKGLCMNCFNQGHLGRDCPRSFVCGIDGCTYKHSRFLHLRRDNTQTPGNPNTAGSTGNVVATPCTPTSGNTSAPATQKPQDTGQGSSGSCSFAGARIGKVALPIVPVRVRRPENETYVDTYALLDQGSTVTFCTDALANTLGAPRQRETLELTTLSGKERLETTYVRLEASDLADQSKIDLQCVYTRPDLGVGLSSFASDEDLRKWEHFNGIDIPNVDAGEVQLIIGNNVPQALMPLEVRSGQPGEPYATRTLFGWAINGPVGDHDASTATSYFVSSDVALQQQVNQFWELEDIGRDIAPLSATEKRVLSEWDRTAEVVDGHYVLGTVYAQQQGCGRTQTGVARQAPGT